MMQRAPWYEELFDSEDYVRFWLGGPDATRIAPERTEREVEFILSALELEPGARVLDLCCGYGRHSVALAKRGYQVTGIDRSERQLTMARTHASAAGAYVAWVQADMREVPAALAGEMDAVINMFTAFGYFETEAEDQRVLAGIARSLKPGGKFLIDLIHRDGVMRRFRQKDWEEFDGAVLLHERRFDFASGQQDDAMTVVEADGSRRTTTLSLRWYTLTELRSMLGKEGLEFRRAWGDFDASDLGLDSRRMIVLAEKAG